MAKKQTVEHLPDPTRKLQVDQQEQLVEHQEQRMGLDHLDDETLANIVARDVRDSDGESIKSWKAEIAFQELAKRSGHDIER